MVFSITSTNCQYVIICQGSHFMMCKIMYTVTFSVAHLGFGVNFIGNECNLSYAPLHGK